MGVPVTGVGSRWLECLTRNPHASMFSESMLPRLHIFMSALTHPDQVFLDLPLPPVLGIIILVMEFVHEEEHVTCPNQLIRLLRRAAVTSCTPNIAQYVRSHFVFIWTPHIQRIIDLSFLLSHCKSSDKSFQILPEKVEWLGQPRNFSQSLQSFCYSHTMYKHHTFI